MSALRNIRERKGFNISQLASRSGISGKTLLEYEEGRQIIPLTHARLLAKALWVEVDELIPPPGTVLPTPSSPTAPPVQQVPKVPQPRPIQPVSPVKINMTQAAPPAAQPSAPVVPVAHSPQAKAPGTQHNGQGVRPDTRAPRTPKPVQPATDGQLQELLQLAHRLDISQEQLEERIGKALATLTRPDATDWVKRLRAIADEIAPASKVKYGRWPDASEDREAAYLAKQREAGTICTFHLFNGEEFSGHISDFTPYTVTIRITDSQEEIVLRKLAIAYYRCLPVSSLEGSVPADKDEQSQPSPSEERPHDHARDDHHQPLDKGIDSDRAGQPDTPPRDKMDEDRGM